MGIFKDDDDVKEELMTGFDDANVDTDLLSQIFADNSDDAELEKALADDSDLGGDLSDLLSGLETVEESAKTLDAKESEKKDTGKSGKGFLKNSGKKENKKDDKVETATILEPEPEKAAGQASGLEAMLASDNSEEIKTVEENKEIEKEEEKKEEQVEMSIPEEHGDGTLTVISEGTTINGGISTEGNLEVSGTVNGDIEAKGKVTVVGLVMGSVVAADIEVNTKILEGSLKSEGHVQVGENTVVIGDVTGVSANIAGAIKGTIDVNGSLILENTARIKGDIKTKSIQINEGAFMDGHCVLSYSDVDIDSIFEESKKSTAKKTDAKKSETKKSEDKKSEDEKK